jgi:hypothetical protein
LKPADKTQQIAREFRDWSSYGVRAAPERIGELAQIEVLIKELTAIEPCRKSREPARCAIRIRPL